MHRIFIILVPFLCLCVGIIGYLVGHHSGYDAGVSYGEGIQRGTAVVGFSALKKFHDGNQEEAMQLLESMVFRSWVELDKNPEWHDWTGFNAMLAELRAYRTSHAQAEYDAPVNHEFDALLARR